MLTVDHAQEQGRCVFAVPGDVTQGASYWPNKLIQQGAAVVLETADILDEFGWQHAASGERGAKQTLDLEIVFSGGKAHSFGARTRAFDA